ncbi:MAG: response regulator [Nitrososphaeraceae archaeon]|jgi:DNA-binding NtrC family response regulator|nr:response regulator [Nitrososphaeraceae archaeon]MDW0169845.1 response regulator [Nitrososphaeraceae archaeon]MDW0172172.1 response regulator [Nitrososphaeraceae archaeon]MDW0175783.1 response regulator [Nitrososphaeraceae archaeon]MDW0180769.1 response regulator [Nitrososphaeraceae archaeon]
MAANEKIVSVVDDDLNTTELFHVALSENIDGISVVSFNDPVIALEHFAANKDAYVLVISDLRMPGLNGLELLKKVKSSNPKVRTILMSAYNFDEDLLFLKYMEEGTIDSSIDKPITINRLCQRVRDELENYQVNS